MNFCSHQTSYKLLKAKITSQQSSAQEGCLNYFPIRQISKVIGNEKLKTSSYFLKSNK